PFTVEVIMCLTANSTSVWAGSICQVLFAIYTSVWSWAGRFRCNSVPGAVHPVIEATPTAGDPVRRAALNRYPRGRVRLRVGRACGGGGSPPPSPLDRAPRVRV